MRVRKELSTNTKLFELRAQQHKTQKEVAEMSDISVRHYQYIESGQKEPTISKAFRIAEALHTTVDKLFIP